MADETKDTVVGTDDNETGSAGETEVSVKKYTDDDLNGAVAKQKGKTEQKFAKRLGLKSIDDLDDFLDGVNAQKEKATEPGAADDWKKKYEEASEKLNAFERRDLLVNTHKVPADADSIEFYAFKIGKLVTKEKDFSAAAAEYFKEHPVNVAKVSLAGDLSGSGTAPEGSENERMNQIIRKSKEKK